MSFDLTNKNIQDTFQNLLQKTGSEGKLFDLTGNEVRDLTIDGTLTANTYITSESIVNTSSGSTAFGNSSDDTHKFIGNITASGGISSSGNIILGTTKKITFDNNLSGIYLDSPGSNQFDVSINNSAKLRVLNSHITITEQLIAESSITASGGISSSGNVIGTTGIFNTRVTTSDIRSSGDLVTVNDDLHVNGHITASGNISSSLTGSFGRVECQTISASSGQFDGASIFLGGEAFTRANIQTLKQGRSLKPIRLGKTRPDFEAEDGRFDGNITASGDILNTQVVQMTNSSSVINTFDIRNHETCKYVLQVKSGSHIQASEMLVMASGNTAFNTEYAQINSGLNLLNFSSKMTGKTIEIIGSGSFISCSIKFVRTLI